MTTYWFKPKTYGFGARPVTWQGWASSFAVMIGGLAVMMTMVVPVAGRQHPMWEIVLGLAIVAALVGGFTLFAQTKTEGGWRWRWGKDSN